MRENFSERQTGVSTVLGVTSSLSKKHWVWREAENESQVDRIAEIVSHQCGVSRIIARIMVLRGITPEQAQNYLKPLLQNLLPDPSCLFDMDKAADRIARAVMQGEVVGVFGDYDVDGTCSSVILADVLESLGCRVLTYIPDRIAEGYGPNQAALEGLVTQGASLLICVDCGTAAADVLNPIAKSVAKSVDIIVIDHHKSEDVLPSITAVVNPNRSECNSGLYSLCAAALTFFVMVATRRVLREAGWFSTTRPEPDLRYQLDLVALATVCDVMPLQGLNRALVTQGLKIMAQRHRLGLSVLMETTGITKEPDAFSCGFVLGPRINAGGRIAKATLGLDLLLCQDEPLAQQIALKLDEVNRRRQRVESTILDHAMADAAEQKQAGRGVLVISGKDWPIGVVGIVAGRIKEHFNRPTLVGSEQEDGVIKGSGRSVVGIDLGHAIIAARQAGLLKTGGGHAMAAGFSFEKHRLAELQDFLDSYCPQAVNLPDTVDLTVDIVLCVSGATVAFAQQMAVMAPFGAGNPEPVIALSYVTVVCHERIGREGQTLRVFLQGENGGRLKALLFRADETPLAEALEETTRPLLHVAGYLRAENWNDRTDATFFIQDVAYA